MVNWFKEVVECKKCIFSEDGQRVDFCDTHALTPKNLEHYLSSKQRKNGEDDA